MKHDDGRLETAESMMHDREGNQALPRFRALMVR
jgi:hypothetical protein